MSFILNDFYFYLLFDAVKIHNALSIGNGTLI